jgi:hypothetical protein
MASERQFNARDREMHAPFAVFAGMGRKAQAIAAEITKMSQENIDASAKAAQKLGEVRSLPEVIDIQTDLVRATLGTLGAHYPRIAEIAVSTPVEIIRSYQEAFGKIAEEGGAVAHRAADTSRSLVEKTTAAAREATGKTAQAVRPAKR